MPRPQAPSPPTPHLQHLARALTCASVCAFAFLGCQSQPSAPAAPTTLQAPPPASAAPTQPIPATAPSLAPAPPAPVALDPSYDDAFMRALPSLGPLDAPHLLLVFIDPEDPADRNLLRELDLLRQLMPQDALLTRAVLYPKDTACNKHIGRSLSPSGCVAARALLCAHDASLFWPMLFNLRTFFEVRDQQAPERRALPFTEGDAQSLFAPLAETVPGFDPNRFAACLSDPATDQRIAEHASRASDLGVGVTPAWRVNGVTPTIPALVPAYTLQTFIEAQPARIPSLTSP